MSLITDHSIFIAGPTGCGKSSVALALAEKTGPDRTAIVNADAFQIYREMDILTAAPTSEDLEKASHFLYKILDPTENCDAARYSRIADKKLTELIDQKRLPLIVGGSGLYLKTLTHGLGPVPPGDPELRAGLDQLSDEELVAKLEKLDPEGAAEMNLQNRRYVMRSVEISILAGVPASTLKRDFENSAPDFRGVFLTRDREILYDRINRRTHEMFADGVVEEVAALGELSTTAEKAIGLREIRELIAGTISQDECIEQIQQATRRYSKRQRTWFKRESGFKTLEIGEDESADEVAEKIHELFF